MHYLAIVLLSSRKRNIDKSVAKVMKPYQEKKPIDWDWYQIGGRWAGWLGGYNPKKDPANIQECRRCRGVGCARCDGKGEKVKWPTDWVRHAGDISTIDKVLTKGKIPYALIWDGGAIVERRWNGKAYIETKNYEKRVWARLKKDPKAIVVVIDYHS